MKLTGQNIRAVFELLSPHHGYEAEFSFEGYSARVRLDRLVKGVSLAHIDDRPGILNSSDVRGSWEITSDVVPTCDTMRYDKFILGCHIAELIRLVPTGSLPIAVNIDTQETMTAVPVNEVVYVQIGNDNVFAVSGGDADATDGTMIFTRVRAWTEETTPPWMEDLSNCVRIDYGNVTGAREVLNSDLQAEEGFMGEVFASGTEAAVYSSLTDYINMGCVVAMDMEEESLGLAPIIRWKDDNMCIMYSMKQEDGGMHFINMMDDEQPLVSYIHSDDIGKLG